jgi:hypothetical protein
MGQFLQFGNGYAVAIQQPGRFWSCKYETASPWFRLSLNQTIMNKNIIKGAVVFSILTFLLKLLKSCVDIHQH